MSRLAVIVGFGGVNAAGRSSFHHSYRRMVASALSESDRAETRESLSALMRCNASGALGGERWADADPESPERWLEGSLVRRLDWSGTGIHPRRALRMSAPSDDAPVRLRCAGPVPSEGLPAGCEADLHADGADVSLGAGAECLLPVDRSMPVNSAGQMPDGFDPGALYRSRHHPRGLQMTVFGASDALRSIGLSWEAICERLSPDDVSVYAGSGMSQLDAAGNGGMLNAALQGGSPSSKNCPFGFAQMPADFINAYLLGGMGATGANLGACASFLYSLRQGVHDIRSGRARLVVVGASEAPILPEVIDGYASMGALATDAKLARLDGVERADHRRACRPFAENCGFVLGESAQFVVLCDDALALELGASMHAAVAEVFINADGYKRSIASPGAGNYLTMARAAAAARAVVGDDGLRERSWVSAHGTGTPQNRVTESHVLDETARAFGVARWPVSAVKSYLGHSIGAAGGDQLIACLGTWRYGWLPGIATMATPADDVHRSRLALESRHCQRDPDSLDAALVNSKGFGGNNATALALSPAIAHRMLERKHGAAVLRAWRRRNEAVAEAAADYDRQASRQAPSPIYRFGREPLRGEDLELDADSATVPGYGKALRFDADSLYPDML